MTRYADQECEPCEGTGQVEVVTPNGEGGGWVTCATCGGIGDV
jgi:DnaJ-class molecular chaperone